MTFGPDTTRTNPQMTVTLWCWRCRKDVIMLAPHEWGVIQEARRAGRTYLDVLEREAARAPGRSFSHLAANASPEDRRLAYLVQAYELFAGEREFVGRIKEHHQSALYGPPCAACGRPLRTPQARQCASCGVKRPDLSTIVRAECGADRVRLHAWPFRSIDEVLAEPLPRLRDRGSIGDDGPRFLEALANVLLIGRRSQPLSRFPELARMGVVLQQVHLMVRTEKTFYVLDGEDGNELPRVAAWCRVIGAQRFLAFTEALLALYPAELQDDQDARQEYLNDRDDYPSVVTELEQSYWDAPLELPDRMRSYVLAHRDQFDRAMAG